MVERSLGYKLLTFSLSLFGTLGCGVSNIHENFSSTQKGIKESSIVRFEQPKILPSDVLNAGGHPDQQKVPQGLCVVDSSGNCAAIGLLDRSKPTIIYVHGWTADGQSENVTSAAKWTPNFNVTLFRWHHDSYDPKIIPSLAEARIWSVQRPGGIPAYQRAAAEYKRLVSALGSSYSQEIRLVGHSLGTQVVVGLAAALDYENFPIQPTRIELLDPAVLGVIGFPSLGLPYVSGAEGKNANAVSVFTSQIVALGTFSSSVATGPYRGRLKTRVIVSYLSASGFFDFRARSAPQGELPVASGNLQPQTEICVVRDLFLKLHSQQLAGDLLGGSSLWAGLTLGQRHLAIRDYYFDSISQTLPKLTTGGKAFSAAMTTSEIQKFQASVHAVQVGGEKTVSIEDDTYKIEQKSGSSCLFSIHSDPTTGSSWVTVPIIRF